MTNDTITAAAVPVSEAQPVNRYLQYDGRNPRQAMKAGLEITGICIVGIAVILTLYYLSLRLLAAAFPAKKESDPGTGDD